jgi:hypothetical protein
MLRFCRHAALQKGVFFLPHSPPPRGQATLKLGAGGGGATVDTAKKKECYFRPPRTTHRARFSAVCVCVVVVRGRRRPSLSPWLSSGRCRRRRSSSSVCVFHRQETATSTSSGRSLVATCSVLCWFRAVQVWCCAASVLCWFCVVLVLCCAGSVV